MSSHMISIQQIEDSDEKTIEYHFSDSIKDISERMQMSESAVKVTLHRTRKELRRYMESEGLYL